MRRRKPWAINMRVECMLTVVILRLQAIDLTTFSQCTDSDVMRVPGTSGRREFRIITDRKSTRLNSSHLGISYAVFCLKKKQQEKSKTHKGMSSTQRTLDIIIAARR